MIMKIVYDQNSDVLDIWFSNSLVAKNEGKPGIIMDYDDLGNLVHIMIIDASKMITNPKAIDYAIKI